VMTPHPGQVKAELNSLGDRDADGGQKLSQRIHEMLFADQVEQEPAPDA